MRSERLVRAGALLAVLASLAVCATGSWAVIRAQEQDPPDKAVQDEDGQAQQSRRRVRLVLPFSALEDLSPRQEATIRDIRREIMQQRDELDRIERERIMEVLTEAQRQRVLEIEAERSAREQERAREAGSTTRQSGGESEGDQ